ncbi:MAG: 4-aminobutyrate--2-oxoglutarate transaminase [Methyloceanibacter sp.]|uniref:4-aminobutyrate--2-oxoglutarate transaminase n=1 Tax=Methyloceanibacter sp. TaxID=1965321 RepID=UPI003D9B7867
MPTSAELHERRVAAVPRGVSQATAIYAQRAKNAEIWSEDGKRYIDFGAGIAVVNTGHQHPRIVAAVEQQMKLFSHVCFQVTPYESYVRLAERLNAIAPVAAPAKTMLLSTGAEAVENAVKVARAYTGRPGIISFSGGFHGRTHMGMALTGKVVPYKKGFGPFPADIYNVAFPNTYHGVSGEQSLAAINALFKYSADPSSIAAIIIEPVQGEGGFYIAPFDFLRALRELCDEHGILLIADEIQTGFARTGKMFALEHVGIKADVVTMAKGLAGGFPLSAITGRADVMDAASPGGLGGTYAGNPVACAAAHAVLDAIDEEGLCERANAIGRITLDRCNQIKDRSNLNCVGDVRGLGAMCAIELVKDTASAEPAPQLTQTLMKVANENWLILLSCGTYGNVIRFLVPLTASDAIVREGMDIFETSLAEAVTRAA